MLQLIFTFIIYGVSIYFFYHHNFFIGLTLFVWVIFRSLEDSLVKLFENTNLSELNKKSNILIELKINLAELFKSKEILTIFEKLKKEKKINFQNFSEWIEIMIENYKKKFNNQNDFTSKDGERYIWEVVKFNIKNNILWKNNQIDFNDSVYHEIFIPFEYKNKEAEELFEEGLYVRVFVVNGLIKLQIGRYDEKITPKFFRREGLAVYQTYSTITLFPLMYVFQEIPTNYLNLSAYATESWKNIFKKDNKSDFMADWKILNKEIIEYNYIKDRLALNQPGNDRKFNKLYQKFYKKGSKILITENFKDPYKKNKDINWSVPGWMEDNDIHYLNKFLYILIANYKDLKEKRERYNYIDYYEEIP